MVTITTTLPPAPDRPPKGHCSRCGKVWTLKTRQGVCQCCFHLAYCQSSRTKPRHIKSSRRRKQKQANGNGYDQLPEPEHTYYIVASKHAHRAKAQDTEDLLHTIILTLMVAERNTRLPKLGGQDGHKPFTLGTMHRIASRTVFDYWRQHFRINNGLDCHSCSKAQRRKCKQDDLYSDCPKAIKLESLDKPILDSEGNLTTLGETIADPRSVDIDAWDRDYLWQIGYKPRLVAIANKLKAGIPLDKRDQKYLERYRREAQKSLFENVAF